MPSERSLLEPLRDNLPSVEQLETEVDETQSPQQP